MPSRLQLLFACVISAVVDDHPEVPLFCHRLDWCAVQRVQLLWVVGADVHNPAFGDVGWEKPLLRPLHQGIDVVLQACTTVRHPTVQLGVISEQLDAVGHLCRHIVDEYGEQCGPKD